jgi:hypothetical protein
MTRTLLLGLILIGAAGPAAAHAAEGSAAWTPNDISVSQTEAVRSGVANTRFEVGPSGDARLTVDLREGGTHLKGTILLIAGRWMLTQGFAAAAGKEVGALDVATLNSQLVIVLLTAVLPNGPPAAGTPQHVRFAEKNNPIRMETASKSADYHAPWTVVGSVSVPAADAPVTYQLSFTYSQEGVARTLDFAGTVATVKSPLELPDSMKLAGWKIRRLGTDPGSPHPPLPTATTLGELRRLE